MLFIFCLFSDMQLFLPACKVVTVYNQFLKPAIYYHCIRKNKKKRKKHVELLTLLDLSFLLINFFTCIKEFNYLNN